jgi:sugar fermentation stimulation protein A
MPMLEETGEEITAHCPNPGAMLGLATPGADLAGAERRPQAKLKYGWRLVELDRRHLAGIDTGVPNRVVARRCGGPVAAAGRYHTIRAEVPYGTNSRVDFLCSDGLADAYVEVKNVHLRRSDDWAEFPDSVTARGAKHLQELTQMVADGHRAIMLYLVQRTDCARFRLAPDLDPGLCAAFDAARAAGVEMLGLWHRRSTGTGVSLGDPIPVDPAPQAV